MNNLCTRDDFRKEVFNRDGHKCIVCKAPAADAHHLIERRLWGDGGYYLNNGVSLCAEHHLKAEDTTISCEELRKLAGITQVIVPEHFTVSQRYDKWGNPILDNGQRMIGELYFEEPVQKMLAQGNVLNLFTKYVKYPRTYHFPWSPGISSDDKVMSDLSVFEGRDVVVTAKLDGENTSMYNDYLHARSLTYKPHDSRSYVKQIHASICQDIPEGWRICGENLYAEHSIHYNNLPGYFLVFSIWNHHNICLAWDETVEWSSLLGLPTVPVLYRGPWNERLIRGLYTSELNGDPCEGYVVRLSCSFHYKNFKTSVAKVVRAGHVTTDEHWLEKTVTPNQLKR